MRNSKKEYSLFLDFICLNLLKTLALFIIFRKIFEFAKFGHNQNIDVAYEETEIYVLPPLSGSSSAIELLESRGYKIAQINLSNLYDYTNKYNKIMYIERPDCERLKSFYTKKILNNNTFKKFIIFLGHRGFYYVKSFDDYVLALTKSKTFKNIKRDKHLLLNDDILLNLNSQKVFKINMARFLVDSKKLNVSSQLIFHKEITNQQKNRLNDLITKHQNQTKNFIDVMFISSRKAGSTYVYEKLLLNEKIGLPSTIKETNYYSSNFQRGIDWYKKQFRRVDSSINVEVCPTYGSDVLALQRIFKLNPNITVVMLVRDPLRRATSHYRHLSRNRWVKPSKNMITFFPEILSDSQYSVIYQQLLETGFSKNKIKVINVDDQLNFDRCIEFLFDDNVRSGFLPNQRVYNRNVGFQVRYKVIYLLLRKLNFSFNKLGIHFPRQFKNKALNVFKLPGHINDRTELYLKEYEGLFKLEREFLEQYFDKI